jgi:phosphoribosyl-AMP cyclohydrolase
MSDWLDEVGFDEKGLVPAIAQDAHSGKILMMAWMNREALRLTAEKREAVYWSRSRDKLWHKGVILLKVEQMGGIACHTGRESCFYRVLDGDHWVEVDGVIKDPHEIYGD